MADLQARVCQICARLETFDLSEWTSANADLAELGPSAVGLLARELLKSVGSLSYPNVLVQRGSTFPLEMCAALYTHMNSSQDFFDVGKGAVVVNVTARKLSVADHAQVQMAAASLIYVGTGGIVDGAMAEEIWVAPDRTVKTCYAQHILAGFPPPPRLPAEDIYYVDNPAEVVFVIVLFSSWGFLDVVGGIL
jgi:hypothetical protein